ncbi:MAG: M14 family metallopeptidase [Eubacteriaceae bacterium]
MNIGGLKAHEGEKIQGEIPVTGTDLKLPATIIRGTGKLKGSDKNGSRQADGGNSLTFRRTEPGKTVLITAGVHNAEYVGIQAALKLAEELEPDQIYGNLIILPLINRSGFEHRTMSTVFEDGKNINRTFPGSPDGTTAERLCWFMEKELFPKADYLIDLHSGDGFEELSDYVYCQGIGAPEVCRESENMARSTKMPYAVRSESGTGGAYNYAGTLGLPAILIERGCSGQWSHEEAGQTAEDVRSVLKYLDVIEGETVPDQKMRVLEQTHYVDSNHTGCWYPEHYAGNIVEEGDLLGVVKDYFGNVLEVHRAEERSIILYQTISLSVLRGSPLIAYSKWEEEENGVDGDESAK